MVLKIRVTASWAVRSLAAAERAWRFRPGLSRDRWVRALGAAGWAFMLCSATADVPSAMLRPTPRLVFKPDPRADRLERFFRAYRCPQPHRVAEYLRAADVYDLDYRLLPAISVRESTCGAAQVDNNFWGYRSGRQGFASVEEGIDFVARQLMRSPYYKGKTLPGKLFTYNPLPAYPSEVQRIMRQIE